MSIDLAYVYESATLVPGETVSVSYAASHSVVGDANGGDLTRRTLFSSGYDHILRAPAQDEVQNS